MCGRIAVLIGSMVMILPATENETRLGGFGHLGVWRNNTVRLTGGAGLASVNLKYYGGEDHPRLSDGVEYNIDGWGALAQVIWRLGRSETRSLDSSWRIRQHWGEFLDDFDYTEIDGKHRWYFHPSALWVLAWRLDGSFILGEAPFYARPSIDQRGIADAPSRWSGGFGARYLIARLLGLQVGVDVARGPEEWAFYIQMGNGWSF